MGLHRLLVGALPLGVRNRHYRILCERVKLEDDQSRLRNSAGWRRRLFAILLLSCSTT